MTLDRRLTDDLQTLPSRLRSPSQSPPRSPFLTAFLRRQSKNDQTKVNFKEHRRIVVLGAAKVGKSAIIRQFLYDQFTERYTRTVEDLYIAEYNLSNGASLTLEILDTTGSYQFPAMRALSISNGDAFILTYSVNDENSWNEIKELRQQVINCNITYVLLLLLFLTHIFSNFFSCFVGICKRLFTQLKRKISSMTYYCYLRPIFLLFFFSFHFIFFS